MTLLNSHAVESRIVYLTDEETESQRGSGSAQAGCWSAPKQELGPALALPRAEPRHRPRQAQACASRSQCVGPYLQKTNLTQVKPEMKIKYITGSY